MNPDYSEKVPVLPGSIRNKAQGVGPPTHLKDASLQILFHPEGEGGTAALQGGSSDSKTGGGGHSEPDSFHFDPIRHDFDHL